MLDDSSRRKGSAQLSGDEWEERLTRHFLHAEGPFGMSAMTFMDASCTELASACGIPEESPELVAASFLRHFRRQLVELYLSGETRVSLDNPNVPGFFRYLVLTCAVSTDVVPTSLETNDFRQRLGEIMGVPEGFPAVSGVNHLWKQLARWSSLRREEGLPIREVCLPDPGHMTLIGHAVKFAFPAWRDRAAFARVLERLPKETLLHPRRLTDELARPQNFDRIPRAIQETMLDFRRELAAGRKLLGGHRFWMLVTRIVDSVNSADNRSKSKWQLEVRFGGYDQDSLEFRLIIRSAASPIDEPEVVETGDWLKVVEAGDEIGLRSFRRLLQEGCIILKDSGGAWTADGGPPSPGRRVLLLADSSSLCRRSSLDTTWTLIGGGWACSGPVDPAQLPSEFGRGSEDAVRDIELRDGLRTSRVSFLGQPSFLPTVSVPLEARVVAIPGPHAVGNPVIGQGTVLRPIESTTPLDGAWRIAASEGGNRSEILVRFESLSPECASFKSLAGSPEWEPELEAVPQPEQPLASVQRFLSCEPGSIDCLSSEIAEAIYVRAGSGWAEGDLIETLAPVLPHPKMAWDVIRAYAEGGWLDAHRSTRWRGRRWILRPPRLIRLSSEECAVDGALAKRARDRLTSSVSLMGGILAVRKGPSRFGVPILQVSGVAPAALAAAMECEMTSEPVLTEPVLGATWVPVDGRTSQGRILGGRWDFAKGIFVDPAMQFPTGDSLQLERWKRERGDDHDVFVIRAPREEIITLSKTAAVLEAHRRAGIPLFDFVGNALQRCRLGGYLPLPVARSLRLLHGIDSGPLDLGEGRWGYSYPCDQQSAQRVASWLGGAISGVEQRRPPVFEPFAIWKRNPESRRPTWGVSYRNSAR